MYNIDEYIKASAKMENVSDGGSECFDFGNVVLVKYKVSVKYSVNAIARENEELIAAAANKKRNMGVNTPYHLAIKRVTDEKDNICYVLQEKAKGASFNIYYKEPTDQLQVQELLLEAPDTVYEKCVSDLCELFNMGLELKGKNIFYDNSKDGAGFTFIDLLGYDTTPLNSDSISDVIRLDKMASFIYNIPRISTYSKTATKEQIEKSTILYYKMKQKTFEAMEKVVPTFSRFRRWVLRTYSNDVLNFFEKNGTVVGNLALNDDECREFDNYIEQIINECLEKLATGKNKFWQIRANEIRIALDTMGMQAAWKYHSANPINDPTAFDDKWDFERAREKYLEDIVNNKFAERLESVADTSLNANILKAKEDMDEEKVKYSGKSI